MDIETFQSLELDRNFTDAHGQAAVNGRRNIEIVRALDTDGDLDYHPCTEAMLDGADPASSIAAFSDWASEGFFTETSRDVWIVAPPGLMSTDRPAVLVFNDGGGYLDPQGAVRARPVLDLLRDRGVFDGPIVGVFVSPGRPRHVLGVENPFELNREPEALRQRSIEYDSMSATYGSFLADELLPFVEDHLQVELDPDPSRRGIVGISSGGIAAWTAAWHRPDSFGLVLSHCGSFVNIRGGHNWPYLIRSNERRDIKVFLQSGALDANIIFGNWPLANQQVAAALEFAGYTSRFEFGTGGHNLRHAGSLFADSLRWLFAN